jgi:hypothetical protein
LGFRPGVMTLSFGSRRRYQSRRVARFSLPPFPLE